MEVIEQKLRRGFDNYLSKAEVFIYAALGTLLSLTALVTVVSSGKVLWDGLGHWTLSVQSLRVLNELLIVLMLVEILHTVRISIRSHTMVIEPFLIVGLIASIRRILVITLEAATLSKEGVWATDVARSIFHSSMMEMALLGLLVLILVFCIPLLRRQSQAKSSDESAVVL